MQNVLNTALAMLIPIAVTMAVGYLWRQSRAPRWAFYYACSFCMLCAGLALAYPITKGMINELFHSKGNIAADVLLGFPLISILFIIAITLGFPASKAIRSGENLREYLSVGESILMGGLIIFLGLMMILALLTFTSILSRTP